MIEAMENYFERLRASWKDREGTLPKAAVDEDAQPLIYVGEPDEEGYVEWRATRKTVSTDLGPVEEATGQSIHPSVREYLNSYWFAELFGKYGGVGVTLAPVLPGLELTSFLTSLAGYKEAHDDRIDHIPVGTEFNGDLVVIDNKTGEVLLEDYERGAFRSLAPNLETLIAGLKI